MTLIINVLIGFIAFLHLYFLWLEMFAWTTRAPKVFRGFDKEYFQKTKAMAANQGLYNGFLSAGLIWGLMTEAHPWRLYILIFFLSCILIAGLYGAYSVNKRIFYIQGLPTLIAIILLHI